MSSYTYCRTSYVGWISSVIRVITPRAPSPTTAPWKTSPSALRDSFTTSPAAVTISRAETAVARLPFFSPEPCLAVLLLSTVACTGSRARDEATAGRRRTAGRGGYTAGGRSRGRGRPARRRRGG